MKVPVHNLFSCQLWQLSNNFSEFHDQARQLRIQNVYSSRDTKEQARSSAIRVRGKLPPVLWRRLTEPWASRKRDWYTQGPQEETPKTRGSPNCEYRNPRTNSNSNSKTLFYKDCSLGSVKNLTTSPCWWLVLMSIYKITGIIYIHISMNEWVKFYIWTFLHKT